MITLNYYTTDDKIHQDDFKTLKEAKLNIERVLKEGYTRANNITKVVTVYPVGQILKVEIMET